MINGFIDPSGPALAEVGQHLGWVARIGRMLRGGMDLPPDPNMPTLVPRTLTHGSQFVVDPLHAGSEVELFNVHTDSVQGGTALFQVSFRLHAGERVAIVGRPGSGRSTLSGILLGRQRPSSGRVTIAGIDLGRLQAGRDAHPTAWIHGASLPDGCTIAQALAADDPDVSETDIHRVIWLAKADDFVGRLSKGIHTVIGSHGVRPPQTVCRRLSVARALLHPSPVLVVDERGLEADPSTRGLIDAAWMSGEGGTTTIFVCDDLHRMERFDRILVLSQGRLVECGHHSALMAVGGEYAAMQASRRAASRAGTVPRAKAS